MLYSCKAHNEVIIASVIGPSVVHPVSSEVSHLCEALKLPRLFLLNLYHNFHIICEHICRIIRHIHKHSLKPFFFFFFNELAPLFHSPAFLFVLWIIELLVLCEKRGQPLYFHYSIAGSVS